MLEESGPVDEFAPKVNVSNIDIYRAVVTVGGEDEEKGSNTGKDGGGEEKLRRAMNEKKAGKEGAQEVGERFE